MSLILDRFGPVFINMVTEYCPRFASIQQNIKPENVLYGPRESSEQVKRFSAKFDNVSFGTIRAQHFKKT